MNIYFLKRALGAALEDERYYDRFEASTGRQMTKYGSLPDFDLPKTTKRGIDLLDELPVDPLLPRKVPDSMEEILSEYSLKASILVYQGLIK